MTSVIHSTHGFMPPLWWSHSRFMKLMPAGGSVTTASMLSAGSSRSRSMQSP
jgi:hypothetical protein